MAISKYERDLDVPGSAILIRLAQAMGVKTEYFLRPVTIALAAPNYRRRASLPAKEEATILGQIQEWLERYMDVESLLGGSAHFDLPNDFNHLAASMDDVERIALDLRRDWHLGWDAIENLVEVLEDHAIKVGQVDGHEGFDALTVWANGSTPVIVVKRDLPGDQQRFNLAHELGHLILETVNGIQVEKAAHRFAGAFLVPDRVARFELGSHRQTLDLYELHLLKHKYGLGMQAWICRAKDLGIVSESAATALFWQFRKHGWHHQEPGDPIPSEQPARMKRLVLRLLAEDVISESRAAELLGMPTTQFWQQEAEQHAGFPADIRG